MMAENSHLISKMPERETGLPNTYSALDENLSRDSGYDSLNGIAPKPACICYLA